MSKKIVIDFRAHFTLPSKDGLEEVRVAQAAIIKLVGDSEIEHLDGIELLGNGFEPLAKIKLEERLAGVAEIAQHEDDLEWARDRRLLQEATARTDRLEKVCLELLKEKDATPGRAVDVRGFELGDQVVFRSHDPLELMGYGSQAPYTVVNVDRQGPNHSHYEYVVEGSQGGKACAVGSQIKRAES